MRKSQLFCLAGSAFALLVCVSASAQSVPAHNKYTGESVYSQIDRKAAASRSGDASATLSIVHHLFTTVAIPNDVADAFGFTDRIVRAESEYQSGARPPVHQADIVKAVNNMVASLGAPQWARTTPAEVIRLRMHLLVLYPQLIANQGPPDEKGNYHPLNDKLRPVEAAFIATTMLYQKAENANFQFTEEERQANAKLHPEAVNAAHLQRSKDLHNMLEGRGQTVSLRDMLTISDRFYSDLGIESKVFLSKGFNYIGSYKGGQ